MVLTPTATPEQTAPVVTVEERFAVLEERLNLLKAQVRQAQQLASLGTVATTIAHEFSNMLSPVMAYAQVALQDDDPSLSKKALELAVKNIRVLSAMSERILHISAPKAASMEAVSVREVVEDGAASLCRDFSKDGITFSNDVPEDLNVIADPLHLQQVFFNLLLNARQALAAKRGGRVTVSTRREGEMVSIQIKDTGEGIPPDRINSIFDALNTSKSPGLSGKERCGGLGLALCRDLVEECGGTIGVESEAGAGTTFTLRLRVQHPASS